MAEYFREYFAGKRKLRSFIKATEVADLLAVLGFVTGLVCSDLLGTIIVWLIAFAIKLTPYIAVFALDIILLLLLFLLLIVAAITRVIQRGIRVLSRKLVSGNWSFRTGNNSTHMQRYFKIKEL